MAINYNAVAAPRAKRVAPGNEIALTVPSAPGMGGVFTASIYFVGMGDVQGVTIQLGFDPTVLRPVTTLGGPLLGQQTLGSMVLTGVPGTVDIALLGDGPGITNGGVLATMSFQVIGTGNTIITLASTSARDARNRPVSLQQVTAAREIVPVPATTALGAFFPNPARDHLAIEYALHENAAVRLEIFDTAGRLVRALDDGVQVAGEHSVRWDARDTAGRTVANGTYVLRFRAGGYVESRRLLVLR